MDKNLKICLWGCDRIGALKVAEFLYENVSREIVCVVDDISRNCEMYNLCVNKSIKIVDSEEIEKLEDSFDIGISYLYPKLISERQIGMCRDGIINFHPAPLPDYKGVSGICYAICNGYDKWAVTCHYIDREFDTGRIIQVSYFDIPKGCTGIEGSNIVQTEMLKLFIKIINDYAKMGKLESRAQEKKGLYHSKKEIAELKRITGEETSEQLLNKVRGLFFPPFVGAYVEYDGVKYTLVDQETMNKIAKIIKEDIQWP